MFINCILFFKGEINSFNYKKIIHFLDLYQKTDLKGAQVLYYSEVLTNDQYYFTFSKVYTFGGDNVILYIYKR